MTLPSWVPGRTLYHLHSLGAAAGRGLPAITAWLDHVARLGCGGVLLTPIHASSTHGYDTIDPFRLDDRLGTDADFDALVAGCRDRDLRLVLDGVFNHVGREFPRTDWLTGRPWEGHDELPELDHDNPEVLEWAVAVARHWLDRGASGWRFDVAYAIPKPFLASLTEQVRASHPDALLFGEIIHGDQGAFTAATGVHGVTQYELHKAIWSSLHDRNCWELAHALERHAGYCATSTPITFLGNHDVTRIRSRIDDASLEHALAIVATVPGIPCTYYGDELGFTGEKVDGPGGDDAIRQPLPEHAGGIDDRFERWIRFRRDHPELTTAPLVVEAKTNTTIQYRVGDLTVRLDLDGGVELS